MDILVITKYLSILKTKRKPPLHAHRVHSPIGWCLLGCVIYLSHSRDAWWPCFLIILIISWRCLWIISLFFGSCFDMCLANLSIVMNRCEEVSLVLSWKKSHLIVQEGIILGHKVSKKKIEVDKDKVDRISNLAFPSSMKKVR